MTKRLLTYGALALLAGSLFYTFGRWSAHIDQAEQQAIQQAETFLHTAKATHQRLDSLRAAANQYAQDAQKAASRARGAFGALSDLSDSLTRTQTAADSLPIVVAQRDLAIAAAKSWGQAWNAEHFARLADSTRADFAEGRLVEAEQRIQALLEIRTCHLLGVGFLPKCPSRTTTLVVGLASGAAAVILIRRH